MSVPARPQVSVRRMRSWLWDSASGSWLRKAALFRVRPTPPSPRMPWQVRQLFAKSSAPRSIDSASKKSACRSARMGRSIVVYAAQPATLMNISTTIRKIWRCVFNESSAAG